MKNEGRQARRVLVPARLHLAKRGADCVEAAMNLDQLAADAMKRLAEHVARSAGQHKRAIRAGFLALIKQAKERDHVTHG